MEKEYVCDLAVVGCGGAGMCAALKAAQLGKRVVMLEKNASIGGATAMARGIGSVGSRAQKQDSRGQFTVAEMLVAWMEQTNYLANNAIIYEYLKESGATVDWLEDNGCRIEYVGSAQGYHAASKFQTYHLWDVPKIREMKAIFKRLTEEGHVLLLKTAGKRLLRENERVTGLIAEDRDGGETMIRCGAVMLSTGGYGANEDMVLKATRGVKTNGINSGTQTGDGILMGLEVGADTENLNAMEFHGCDSPCDKVSRTSIGGHGNTLSKLSMFPATLWVNGLGMRFTNEEIGEDISFNGNVAFRQGSQYYNVMDQAMIDALAKRGSRALGVDINVRGLKPDDPWEGLIEQMEAGLITTISYRADSLEELAEKVGLPAARFLNTVKDYNAACYNGKDEMFAKRPQYLNPIERGPYYIIEARANQLCSLGGLRVDTNLCVLDKKGEPIPGLYAGGCDCSGGLVNNAYVSFEGITVGWACTSGRLAGQHAVEYLNSLK